MPFKILRKNKIDKFDKQALYLINRVFKDDLEYQKLKKQSKIKSQKIKLTKKHKQIRETLRKITHKHKIWRDLAKKCIECGQCTQVCPTCFCFRFEHNSSGECNRIADSCFFHDFSEVAGEHKFLDSTAKRLYFWYYHKFVRIPDEYNLPGCVMCQRCTKTCPAGINIKKVLNKILNATKA